jgi:hypothetical protein
VELEYKNKKQKKKQTTNNKKKQKKYIKYRVVLGKGSNLSYFNH